MYRDLDPRARTAIHDTLLHRGRRMYQAANPGKDTRPVAYWRDSYLQNHLWVNAAGGGMDGLKAYRRTASQFGSDTLVL